MFANRKSTFLFVLCCAIATYVASDILIFKGPLRTAVGRLAPANSEIVARVSHHKITRSQLARAVSERLWLEGRSPADLTPASLEDLRQTALNDLIDHELLRQQVQAANPPPAVSAAEIDAAMLRFEKRFRDKAEMQSALKSQRAGELRGRIAARLANEKYVEQNIAPTIAVTEQEAREWFLAHEKALVYPERIAARHIFIPTLDHPAEEAKQKLDAALADISAKKKDFATVARETSEDPATKDRGGELGWMTRARLPADFAAPLFLLESHQPALIRTKLGWHLVEITDRKPAMAQDFQRAKGEVIAALEAEKRQRAVEDFRQSLRAANHAEIEILLPGTLPARDPS